MEEAGAHTFHVTGEDATGAAVAFTGDVTAIFLRADDTYIALDGSLNDGAAEVTLVADCYHVPGRFSIAVYVSDGTVSTCVYAAVGNVYRTTSDAGLDSGASIPTLAQLEAAYQQCLGVISSSVRYDVAQSLTEAQKEVARNNIGAGGGGGYSDAVRYGVAQTLTDAQMETARLNIYAEKLTGVEIIPETSGYIRVESPATATSVAMTDGSPTITASSESASFKARYSLLEVTADEQYTVIVRGLGSSAPGMLVIAADGTILDRQTGSSYANEQRRVVTIPDNAKWIYFVRNASTSTSANGRTNRFWKGAFTPVRLNEVEALAASAAVIDESISGSTVTITAEANHVYHCTASSVASLTFTPSSSGICEVFFTSGTTATALTLPSTVKMPDGWPGVETGRVYDLMISDGKYGAVMSWAN